MRPTSPGRALNRPTVVRGIVVALLSGAIACRAPTVAAPDAGRPSAGSSARSSPASLGRGWRTTQADGVRWLVTPDGRRFYSKGVDGVNGASETPKSRRGDAYYWHDFFASRAEWRAAVERRLRTWGFNTRGAWSDPARSFTLPLTVDLGLGIETKLHWLDPFDPTAEARTLARARALTAAYRGDPLLIGYFSDNEVGWWHSALFHEYLKKGPGNRTKQQLLQLLHDQYGGSWSALHADWVPGPGIEGFADLKRAGARLQLRPGGRGIVVISRFTYLCARRYYELVGRAIRRVDPRALVLGDRLPLYYDQDAVRALADQVDVVSTNYNVDTADGWVAPYYFEGLERLVAKPVLVSEFFFAADENRSGNRNIGHLMTVKTQVERARGVEAAIQNFARFPNVVGTHWFQYYDHPRGGRLDGEDYDMGLVDTRDRPYEEVTEVFQRVNPQLDEIHARSRFAFVAEPSGGAPANAQPAVIPRATRPIDVRDGSLLDWDKAATRVTGFEARPAPYVPFADIHLAWAPEGLYLASLSGNYLDLDLLAYEGQFPLSDTFQVHLLVERDGLEHELVIHLAPEPSRHFPGRLVVEPTLYRYQGGRPAETLPVAGHVQKLDKPLPHIALEAFIPAAWLGLERLEPGTTLRMNLAAINFYHQITMSWSPPARRDQWTDDDLHTFRTVVLD